jgi:hypothetical protein
MLLGTLIAQANSVFGQISPPPGVAAYDDDVGGIGIVRFFSVLLQIATLFAGIFVLYQFVMAGFEYITGDGSASSATKVREKLTSSIVGLVIIVASYAIAALIGLLVFGDATFIINPNLTSILQ